MEGRRSGEPRVLLTERWKSMSSQSTSATSGSV